MVTTNKDICNEALDRLGVAIITTFGSDATPQDNFMYRNYAQIWKEVMREAGVNTTKRRAELVFTSMALTLSSGAVGTGVTATAASAFFRAADVGSDIIETDENADATGEATITAFTSSTVVTVENTVVWDDSTPAANYWRLEPLGSNYAYCYEVPSGFVKATELSDPYYPYLIEGNRILTDLSDPVLLFDYYESDPDQWEPAFWQAIVAKLAMEGAWPLTHDKDVMKLMAAQYASKLAICKGAAKSERQPVSRIAASVLLDVR